MAWLHASDVKSFKTTVRRIHNTIRENGSPDAPLLRHSAYNTPKTTYWILITIQVGSKDYASKCRFRRQAGFIGVSPLASGESTIPIILPRGDTSNGRIAVFKNNVISAEIIQSARRHKNDKRGTAKHFGKAIQVEINANIFPKLARLEQGELDMSGNYGRVGDPPEMEGEMLYAKTHPVSRFNANKEGDWYRRAIGRHPYWGIHTYIPIYSMNPSKLNYYVSRKLGVSVDKVVDFEEFVTSTEDDLYWIKLLNYAFPNRADKAGLKIDSLGVTYEFIPSEKKFKNLATGDLSYGIPLANNSIFALDSISFMQDEINKKFKDYIPEFANKVINKEFPNDDRNITKLPNTSEIRDMELERQGVNNNIKEKKSDSLIWKGNLTFSEEEFKCFGSEQYPIANAINKKQYVLCSTGDNSIEARRSDTYESVRFYDARNTAVETPFWCKAVPTTPPEVDDSEDGESEEMNAFTQRTTVSGNDAAYLTQEYIEYPMFKKFWDLELDTEEFSSCMYLNIVSKEELGKDRIRYKVRPLFRIKEMITTAPIQTAEHTVDNKEAIDYIGSTTEITDLELQGALSKRNETHTLSSGITNIEYSPYLYFYPKLLENNIRVNTSEESYEVNLGYYEKPFETEYTIHELGQDFITKHPNGIRGMKVTYIRNGQTYTDIIEDIDNAEFMQETHDKVNKRVKHLPTIPFYFKDCHICENRNSVREIWIIPIPTPFGIIPFPIRFTRKVYQLRASPLKDGDFFYNTGHKFTNLFFKANNLRVDLFDRFENPEYKDSEIRIDNTKKLPAIFRKRQLGEELEPYQQSLRYLERPIINNAPTNFKNVSPSNERKNTRHTDSEVEKARLAKQVYYDYMAYMSSTNPQYQTKYWYKQNFSLIFLLSEDLRNVTHLAKMAWQYLNFVANMNNIPENTWITLELLIPHRINSYIMKKPFKIKKFQLTSSEANAETKNFRAVMEGDIVTCYSKIYKIAYQLDMETYLPNYKIELLGMKPGMTPEEQEYADKVEGIQSELSAQYKWSTTPPSNRKNPVLIDYYNYWKDYSKDWEIYEAYQKKVLADFNVTLPSRGMPTIDFFTKAREYLEQQDPKELIEFYNLITEDDKTIGDKENFFQYNTEFDKYDGDVTSSNMNATYSYTTVHIPKIIGRSRSIATPDEDDSELLVFQNDKYIIGYETDKTGKIVPVYSEDFCGYDTSTLCYMYSKALHHNYKNNRLDKKQFWNINQIDSPNSINVTEVINFFINELKKVLTTSTPYFCTFGEFYWQLSEYDTAKNDAKHIYNLFPKTGEYAIYQMIWETYIIIPGDLLNKFKIYDDINQDSSGGSGTSSGLKGASKDFKRIYERSLRITDMARQTNGSAYYYHYLPLYQDFYKRLSYPNKHFIKRLFLNIEYWSVVIIEEETSSGGLIDALKLVITVVALVVITIITAGYATYAWQVVLAWTTTIFASLALILQALASLHLGSALSAKALKLAKSFALMSEVLGYVNIVLNIGSFLTSASQASSDVASSEAAADAAQDSLLDQATNAVTEYFTNMTAGQALAILNFGLGVVQKVVDLRQESELKKQQKEVEAVKNENEQLEDEFDDLEYDLVQVGALAKYPLDLEKFTNIDRHLSKTNLDMITYEGVEQFFDIFEQQNYLFD